MLKIPCFEISRNLLKSNQIGEIIVLDQNNNVIASQNEYTKGKQISNEALSKIYNHLANIGDESGRFIINL